MDFHRERLCFAREKCDKGSPSCDLEPAEFFFSAAEVASGERCLRILLWAICALAGETLGWEILGWRNVVETSNLPDVE